MSDTRRREGELPLTSSVVHVKALGHYPGKGRQTATESYTSNSLCARQTPEIFGGVSTD